MASTILRISEESHRILQTLSQNMQRSMQDIAHEAIEEYRRKLLFELADEAYEAAADDPEYWQEMGLWEPAALDGLSDENWTPGGVVKSE
jgi:predicted transcriptional regulator